MIFSIYLKEREESEHLFNCRPHERFLYSNSMLRAGMEGIKFSNEFYPVIFLQGDIISFKMYADGNVNISKIRTNKESYVNVNVRKGYVLIGDDDFLFFSNWQPDNIICSYDNMNFDLRKIVFDENGLMMKSYHFIDGKIIGMSKTFKEKNEKYSAISNLNLELPSMIEIEVAKHEISKVKDLQI